MNTEEGKVNDGQQESQAFDPNAFADFSAVKSNNGPSNNNGNENDPQNKGGSSENSQGTNNGNGANSDSDGDGDNSDGMFAWNIGDDDSDYSNPQGDDKETKDKDKDSSTEGSPGDGNSSKENTDGSNSDGGTDDSGKSNSQITEITSEQFSLLSESLGLKATSAEELKSELEKIVEENNRLKENYPKSNETIDRYEKLINLEDEELVRQNLIADGFEGEALEKAIETFQRNEGLMEIEATKIRNTVNKGIDFERKKLMSESSKDEAKFQKEREDGIKELNSYLSSTDEMFGFKMASPEKIDNVRKSHQEYITSGKYLQDITKDEKALAESAWLWRNKDVILKAMQTRGLNAGRADLIKQIGNPDPDAGARTFLDPKSGGEFNPEKFNAR